MNRKIKPTLSRRHLLGITVGFGGAVVLNLTGCGESVPAQLCADPDKLNDEQMSLRTSLRYTERAPGKETCSGCAFFKVQENTACGACELLKGPVNPQGHCDSWSKRETAAS